MRMSFSFAVILFIALNFNQTAVLSSNFFIGDDLDYYETLSYNPKDIFVQTHRYKRDFSFLEKEPVYSDEKKISFSAHNHEFHLALKRDYSIFHNDIKLHDANGDPLELNDHNLHFYDGTVESSTFSSKGYCFGSIRDGIFDGQILTQEGIYYVTKISPSMSHVLNETVHSIIYHEKHVKQTVEDGKHGCGVSGPAEGQMDGITRPPYNESIVSNSVPFELEPNNIYTKDANQNNEEINEFDKESILKPMSNKNSKYRQKRDITSDKNIQLCSLYIRTDMMLWEEIERQQGTRGNNLKTQQKITELIHKHVKKLNIIMKDTTFDGNIQTVLFQIAKLKILDRTNCHPFCERNLDSSPFLDIQSQEDHSDYCLAYSFTSRDWNGGTLGVAWVAELGKSGGICEKYRRTSLIGGWRSYNTGVVTLKNEGKEIHISKSELTFAHEVGHNLGSPHDESSQCVPEQNGKFLMYAYANSGNLPNNAMFSPCSKKKISTVFTNIGRLNGCLEKFDGSFCGDGIKDDGEECDCGVDEEQCRKRGEFDSCYPKNVKGKNCTLKQSVNRPIQCSHPSSGPCCNSQNLYTPLMDKVVCQISDDCHNASYCDGKSAECPDPGPKPDKSTACNENTQVCFEGKCQLSICEHLEIGAKECPPQEIAGIRNKTLRQVQCQITCEINGTCVTLKSMKLNLERSNLVNSTIMKTIKSFQNTPGASCNDGKGYCDVLSRCRDLDPEGPLERFTKLVFNQETVMTIRKFINEKWYIILVSVIAFIAIMAAFIKCFSIHTPSSNPRLPQAYAITDTLRRPRRQLRRMTSFRNEPPTNRRDEPPPAYDDMFGANGANPQPGMEMNNRVNSQSQNPNRASRQPETDINSNAFRYPRQEVAYQVSRQPVTDANIRASRQPGMENSNRANRPAGREVTNRSSRQPR